jgi:hypothetical protein
MYIVKFPSEDGTYVEKQFNTQHEVQTYLNISERTVVSIMNNTCKYTHPQTRIIKGVIITRVTNGSENDRIAALKEELRLEKEKVKKEKLELKKSQQLEQERLLRLKFTLP